MGQVADTERSIVADEKYKITNGLQRADSRDVYHRHDKTILLKSEASQKQLGQSLQASKENHYGPLTHFLKFLKYTSGLLQIFG